MTSLARALLGVALGSCLTLFVHPASRRLMTGILPHGQAAAQIRTIGGPKQKDMPAPKSIADSALWMQLACQKLQSNQPLSHQELDTLLHLAQYMSRVSVPGDNEESNAFWPQMEAVFYDKLGDDADARRAWEQAAKSDWWRDYQASRLLNAADQIGRRDGDMAWHLAGLYYQRRFYVGPVIRDYAKKALSQTSETTKEDVLFRFASLKNAQLMDLGAQSIHLLPYPQEIGDLAAQPPGSPTLVDRAAKDKARGQLYAALNKQGLVNEAIEAKSIYDALDSIPVLTLSFRPTQVAARVSAISVLTASLPGSLLVAALFGAFLWPAGLLVLRYSSSHASFSLMPAIIFGIALGIGVFLLTLRPLAATVTLLSALFLAFNPKNPRTKYPTDFGPAFAIMAGALALLFVVCLVAFFAASSTPGQLLLPNILGPSVMMDMQTQLIPLGLGAIVFALLLLLAPMWAFTRRVSTPFALGHALRTFGISLVILGLGGVVILTPVCVYADKDAQQTMTQLVGNEPYHYINIFS